MSANTTTKPGIGFVGLKSVTRNAILNYPVGALAGVEPDRVDILHEYFVPPERFSDFLTACRETILRSAQSLRDHPSAASDPNTSSCWPGPVSTLSG